MTRSLLLAALAASTLAGGATAQTVPMATKQRPHGAAQRAADLDRDGVVTRQEATAAADRRFAAMDANRDGTVTRQERRADRDTRKRERSDANRPGPRQGDQQLTQAAFRERALRRFDRVDTDHDGRITAQEREAARLLMRARMADRAGPDGSTDDR